MTVIQVLQAITIGMWIAAAIKLFQLWRAPDELPLRAIASGLVCLACAWTVAVRPGRFIAEDVAEGLATLLQLLGVMGMAYFLLMFFIYSVHGAGARRIALRQLVPLVITATTAVVVWLLAPASQRDELTGDHTTAHAYAAVFVLAVIGYVNYALGMALWWCLRYARIASRVPLRRGLRLLSVGLTALEVVGLAVLAKRVAVWSGSGVDLVNRVNNIALIIGAVAFITGLSYPTIADALAAVPVWQRHRRDYRALAPLWHEVNRAFPELALGRTHKPLRPWGVHRRRYRRAIEIRDALVRLGPYYPRASAGDGVEHQAALVVQALKAVASGAEPAEPPHPSPVAGGPDLDSDVRWLVRLARVAEADLPVRSV